MHPTMQEWLAELQQDGGSTLEEGETRRCIFFLKRKKRNCSHRTSGPGSDVCSFHSPAALKAASELDARKRAEHKLRQELKPVVSAVLEAMFGDTEKIQPGSKTYPTVLEQQLTLALSQGLLKTTNSRPKKMRLSAPKHMANPFSSFYSLSKAENDWNKIYQDACLPLYLDVGCARGMMLDELAVRFPQRNYLGIEIRPSLVHEANTRVADKRLGNLHFLQATFSPDEAARLLGSLPQNVLQMVSIQFPDPWRKKRWLRRRLVNSVLISAIAKQMPTGAGLYVSSDVEDVAREMKQALEEEETLTFRLQNAVASTEENESKAAEVNSGTYEKVASAQNNELEAQVWLSENPLGWRSERELICEQQWRPVWRCMSIKVGSNVIN